MTELEVGIIEFLKAAGMPCSPGYIAFKLPSYSFDDVSRSIEHLTALGRVQTGIAGVELTRTDKLKVKSAQPEPSETGETSKAPATRELGEAEKQLNLTDRIIGLLNSSSEPCTPSYIVYRLCDVSFQKVTIAINELKRRGLVEVTPVGIKLTSPPDQAGAKAKDRPDERLVTSDEAKATIATEGKTVVEAEPAVEESEKTYERHTVLDGLDDQDIDALFESLQSGLHGAQAEADDTNSGELLIGLPAQRAEEQAEDEKQPAAVREKIRPARYDDQVKVLGLPNRIGTAFAKRKIRTLLDLALYDFSSDSKGLGPVGYTEIVRGLKRRALLIDDTCRESVTFWSGDLAASGGFFFDQFGTLCLFEDSEKSGRQNGYCPSYLNRLSIESLSLPTPAEAILRKTGVLTVGKLCTYSRLELMDSLQLSNLEISQISRALAGFDAKLAQDSRLESSFAAPNGLIRIFRRGQPLYPSARMAFGLLKERRVPFYNPASSHWLNHEFKETVATASAVGDRLNEILEDSCESLRFACEAAVARWADACVGKMEKGDIRSRGLEIPQDRWWQEAVTAVIGEDTRLDYSFDGHRLISAPLALRDWIESIPRSRATEALELRLSGLTFEETGLRLGVSRTRAQQLQGGLLKTAPVLREDGFGPLYRKYKIDLALFCQVTSCAPEVYRYLEFRYRGKRRNLSHIAVAQQDKSLPESVRESIKAYFIAKSRGDLVEIDGECIGVDRKSAVLYAMKSLASSGVETVDTDRLFVELRHLVEDHGFPEEILSTGRRGLFSWIQRSAFLMAPTQRCIRLHDFGAYKYDDLLDCLEVMSARNIECSAQLIYDSRPDIMANLDIRDCYELHYTIKTQLGEKYTDVFALERTPMLVLGKADRSSQIKELIEEMGPVSRNALADEYSRRYGVTQASFLASFLGNFQQYRTGDIYSIRGQEFSKDELDYVLSILDGHAYFPLSVIRQQFKGTFPLSAAIISDETLRSTGYSISQSLVVKNGLDLRSSFAEAVELQDKFGEGDEGFSPDVFAHPQFASELNMRLRSLSLVEYGRRRYVKTSYLTSIYGITAADIEQFIHTVSSSIPAGEPFTVQRLRHLGLAHRVDDALVTGEFDDSLLQGMLSAGTTTTGFRTSSIGNTTLFCSGVSTIDAPRYIEHVVRREGPLELLDLLDILERVDGIKTKPSILRQLIQRSSLFCVPSLDEMVFSSENEYNDYINDLLGS